MSCLEYLNKKSIKTNEFNNRFIAHVDKSRYNIILNSEETDICKSYALYLLYWISREENANKTVYIVSNNYHQALLIKKELFDLSKRTFLPIKTNSEKYILFENGTKVKLFKLHKNLSFVGETIDFAICIDVAEIHNHVFLNFYKNIFPSLSALKDSKLILSSQANGHNFFHKLFIDAENDLTSFKALRLYYWEDGKKDGAWVKERINSFGEDTFNARYNLIFTPLKGERKIKDE